MSCDCRSSRNSRTPGSAPSHAYCSVSLSDGMSVEIRSYMDGVSANV